MTDNTVILFPEEEGSKSLPSSHETIVEDESEEKPPKYSLPKDKDEPPVVRELMTNAPGPFKVFTFFSSVTCLTGVATGIRVYYP